MAQQSEAGIPRAAKRKWGYDPAQVDAFLERAHALYDSEGAQLTQRDIQNVSFDLARGGYVIAQVDAALARLERAVVDKQTAWEIGQHGRVAWKAQTEELYREISRHADRAQRERFGEGKARTPSYDRKQVDRLIDSVVDKCAAELGVDGVSKESVKDLSKITSDAVANAVFTQRKGRKGYDERQVDYFLNSCVQLLSRIESYERIADYVAAEAEGEPAAGSIASTVSDAPVAPLFDDGARARRDMPAVPMPEPEPVSFAPKSGEDSFDALSQAEQSLFAASRTPAPAAPAAPAMPATLPIATAAGAAATVAQPSIFQPKAPVAAEPSAAPAFQPIATPAAAEATQAMPAPSFTPASTAPTTAVTGAFAASPTAPAPASSIFPASTPAAPAPTPVSPSLAALAQMAESTQEGPSTDTPSFMPHMPSLDMPSTNATGPIAMPSVMPAAPAPAAPAASASNTASAFTVNPYAKAAAAGEPVPAALLAETEQAIPVVDETAPAPTQTPAKPHVGRHSANAFPVLNTPSADFDIPDLAFPSLHFGGDRKEQ